MSPRPPPTEGQTRAAMHIVDLILEADANDVEPGVLTTAEAIEVARLVRQLGDDLVIEKAEVARQAVRVGELNRLVWRIAQETPTESETASAVAQRSAMVAEIGTLRSRVRELEAQLSAQGEAYARALTAASVDRDRITEYATSLEIRIGVLVDQLRASS